MKIAPAKSLLCAAFLAISGTPAAAARFDRLPRRVTLITGPSRSSDIERKLQIGVYGPRCLHIVLVNGE